MPLVQDRCICLRKTEYSETSQILSLFSRDHGLLRAIAKGAHRKTKAGASKFGGGVDLLDVGDAVFTHDPSRDLATLTEWGLRDGHLELRKNLRGMYLAQYAGELVSVLVEEHDAHSVLFDRLEQTLAELGTEKKEEVFLAFELDVLKETGYLPELAACVGCGVDLTGSGMEKMYCSPGRGGLVCRRCEGGVPDRIGIDARLVRLVQGVLKLPGGKGGRQRLPRLTRHQTDPINKIMAEHVEHMLGRRLRVREYVV